MRLTNGNDTFYEIGTKFGILNDKYRAGDLEPYHGLIDFDYTTLKKSISLREAAMLQSNRFVDLKEAAPICNCTGKCSDKRCGCFAKGVKCGSHCHLKKKENCCVNKEIEGRKKKINKRK